MKGANLLKSSIVISISLLSKVLIEVSFVVLLRHSALPERIRPGVKPADLAGGPEPAEHGFGGVMTQRADAAHAGPVHDSCGQHLGVFLGLLAAATLTFEKQIIAPLFGTHDHDRNAAAFGAVAPSVRQVATAFEDDLAEVWHFLP